MNNTLIQADIFFFISTILFSLLSFAVIVAIIYVIRILREAKRIASLVRGEAEKISLDVERLRNKIHENESSATGMLGIVSQIWKSKRKGRKK